MEIENKRVLVTGADGFIGSHLVEALLEEKCHVTAFVYYNSFNSWGWLDHLSKEKKDKITIFMGDIRDPNGVRQALKGKEVIFHLAALIGIPFSYHSPDSYVDTNIKGTLNILQASRDFNVEKAVVTSTSEVYGTAQSVPISEDHPKQGQSPYAATKIAADYIAESFYRSFGLPVVVARPFNTYGPRQSARAIIPTIISQLLDDKNEIKLGSLHPRRDFTYVEDTVQGLIEIAKSEKTVGEEINICSQTEMSIEELAGKLISIIKPEARIILDEQRVRPVQSEVERLLGDHTKMKNLTGWQPRYSFDQGLIETIEWFKDKEHYQSYKADVYNV